MGEELPRPAPWEERRKGVLSLPGGYNGYLGSFREVCEMFEVRSPTPREIAEEMRRRWMITEPSSRHRESFLRHVGLIRMRKGFCYLSQAAQEWLRTREDEILVAALHSRVRFIGEMIQSVGDPKSTEELRLVANRRYGLEWETSGQIDNRRGWLQSAGLITTTEDRRLVITEKGQRLVARLEVHDPNPDVKGDTTISGDSASSQPENARHDTTVPSQVEALALNLVEASIDSKNPDRLEYAVRDAFSFLGFEARRLGGAGKTDVLLDAPLGRNESYSVTVDAKTASSGALTDHQVDWLTLREHRSKHQADYSMLVGPQPSSGRLVKRSEDNGIAVMSATGLAGLCRQHARVPLGLADYRSLFARPDKEEHWKPRGGEVKTSDLDERSQEAVQMRELAAALVNVLSERCMSVGALKARDLWLILLEREDMAEGSSETEIQDLLDMLAHPLVRAVDGDPEKGYMPSSKPAVTRMRLKHLGASIAPESDS